MSHMHKLYLLIAALVIIWGWAVATVFALLKTAADHREPVAPPAAENESEHSTANIQH